jgi:esterase/lipase
MQLFTKPAIGEKKFKLLFLMGATWINKSMFDLSTIQDSFATCLNKQGIETYTFDIYGSGVEKKEKYIGDQHKKNIKFAEKIINDYDVDCVMGYSSGCHYAKYLALKFNIKKLIFLDPRASLYSDKQLIDNDDKFSIELKNIPKIILKNKAKIHKKILEDHINALGGKDKKLITAAYPKTHLPIEHIDFLDKAQIMHIINKCSTKIFFTKNSIKSIKNIFPKENSVFYNKASHWIMIEEHRYKLAKDISLFLKK